MRLLVLLLTTSLLALAPRLAPAQERIAPVVELDTVETTADARRSAFGRVVDVMIASLVEQQQASRAQPRTRRTAHARRASAPATLAATAAAPARAEPRIDISLGERFALPPADAVATQDDGRP